VNLLIALLDEQHEKHASATHWFNNNAPTPKHARRLPKTTVAKLLKQHQVRGILSDEILKVLKIATTTTTRTAGG